MRCNLQACGEQTMTIDMRALQQQTEQAQAIVVTTPGQLLDAMDEGAMHIQVRDHLDLTTVGPRYDKGYPAMLSDFPGPKQIMPKSIQVRWRQLFVHLAVITHRFRETPMLHRSKFRSTYCP